MFEKEIILKEQLAAPCLFQCSPARKFPANAGTLDEQAFKAKVSELKASQLVYSSTLPLSPGLSRQPSGRKQDLVSTQLR